MAHRFADHRLFWREFRNQFHTTGAVLPSGRSLCRALARYVGTGSPPQSVPRRILEVGPGTGAVTAHIIGRMSPCDTLDLVELNEAFVERLRQRFEVDDVFRQAASRSRVVHGRVEDLAGQGEYDLIISGLPLNNFEVANVEQILGVLSGLLAKGGTLSFFQYIAIRGARALVSGGPERARLRGISRVLARLLEPHEIDRDWVWRNVPPAWVHHVRFGQ